MALNKLPLMTNLGKKVNRELYLVTISGRGNTGDTWSLQGNLKNNFSFNLASEWANLFTNLVPGAEFLQKIGDASLTTGVFSQKYFKGGNHLALTVEFRILDEGEQLVNTVVHSARKLSNIVCADPFSLQRSIGTLNNKGSQLKSAAGEIGEQLLQGNIAQAAGEALNGFSKLVGSGRTVSLRIGNVFNSNRMIVSNVGVTYSREMTHNGPLYGDFSVTFETLQAVTRGRGPHGVDSLLTHSNRFNISFDGAPASLNPDLPLNSNPADPSGTGVI